MSNETIFSIVFGIAFSGVVILWVQGIDYMKRNHPDYKGNDLLEEEEENKNE